MRSVVSSPSAGREAPREPGLPFLGALVPITRLGAIEFFRQLWLKHGDTFRVRLGPRNVLAVVHPDAVEHVLSLNKENYTKGKSYNHLRLLTGEGLLTLEGEAWRKRRRLAQPAFHKESIRALTQSMVEVTRDALAQLQRRLPAGGTIEAHETMMHLTLEVVGETLFAQRFGHDRSDTSANAFGEALELLSGRGNVPVAIPMSIPTPGNRRLKRALTLLDEVVYAIIAKARTEKREARRATLLSMLIESRDADTGEGLTDTELRNEVITLVLAGHETTALLLTWGFTLLGRHPEIVDRMRAEVLSVLGDREPTADDLPRLPYLRQVIDEILRLRSPVWTLGRDVVADDVINGYRVYAGETVMPLTFLTQRHPAFWEQPERFDPERFTPERVKTRHNWVYYPFSLGPRMCIGNLFTLVEAQIILAMLLQRADFSLASLRPVPPKATITQRPSLPIPLHLKWRGTGS